MKFDFAYKGQHHCPTGVVYCEDFRFGQAFNQYLTAKAGLNIDSYDTISVAGGAKAILEADLSDYNNDIIAKSINVSFGLHQAQTLVIINHRDCGAYGGSQVFTQNRDKEKNFHFDQLRQAKTKVLTQYPNKNIVLIYADLNNEQTEINFLTVE